MAKNKGQAPKTVRDLFGISLITLGLILLIAVFSDGGFLGRNVVLGLRWALGWVGLAFPICLIAVGVAHLLKSEDKSVESLALGLGIMLAVVATFSHLHVEPAEAFKPQRLLDVGGLVGAGLSWVLSRLVGLYGAYVFLAGAAVAGVVFVSRTSISEMIAALRGGKGDATKPARVGGAPTMRLPRPSSAKKPPAGLREEPAEEVVFEAAAAPAAVDTPASSVQLTMELDRADLTSGGYQLPPLSLLKRVPERKSLTSKKTRQENISILEQTLRDFNIEATVSRIVEGPTVTRYELQIASGTKVTRIISLADDLALALAATDVRVQAPIPGKSAVGIEVPNGARNLVTIGDILGSAEAGKNQSPVAIGIGQDITGQSVVADLAQMPHLLIAGATGSGKSICINSLLVSILMRARPDQVRLVLVDPKRVELSLYNGISHLLVPVVSKPKEAANALAWAVGEMERRYEVLENARVRNIMGFNEAIAAGKYPDLDYLPYIVVIIDELADLMMVAAGEVEDAICRLAQMARAVGIHLVVATQRPSADIITGLIKANITTRIAFAVSSGVDSRVILDTPGAERLVGKGDMLLSTPDLPKPRRVQGAFVTEGEIELITAFIRKQAEPQYQRDILQDKRGEQSFDDFEDELFEDARSLVITTGQASTSALQRRLRVGYSRAARLMDMLEQRGVVGPLDGAKPRSVLIRPEDMVEN